MDKKFKNSLGCILPRFCFVDNTEDLCNAVIKASQEIGVIVIKQQDLDEDLNVLHNIKDILAKHNINIMDQVIYEKYDYYLSVVLHHGISEQQYEERYKIDVNKNDYLAFEKTVKYLLIQAYIDLLGLRFVNNENFKHQLSLESKNVISISRSDIDKFFECPRCFYFSKKYNVKVPFQYQDSKFDLANANDGIIKAEFDLCRNLNKQHPILKINHINAIPLNNTNIKRWRESNYGKDGIKFFDQNRNIIFTGVVDDLLINNKGEFIVVDYKTTSKNFISLQDDQGVVYMRQLSFYAWLLKQNNYPVHLTGYLIIDKPITVISNRCRSEFEDSNKHYFSPFQNSDEYQRLLKFETSVLEIPIDYSWIDNVLDDINDCLKMDEPPMPYSNTRVRNKCSTCVFYFTLKNFENKIYQKNLNE